MRNVKEKHRIDKKINSFIDNINNNLKTLPRKSRLLVSKRVVFYSYYFRLLLTKHIHSNQSNTVAHIAM